MPPLPGVEFRGIGFSQPNTPRVPTANIGEGLQQVAAAGKYVANVLDVMAEDDGRIYADKINTQARLKAREAMQQAETSGEDLTGISERLAKSAEDEWKAAYDAAPNRHAQRFLDAAKESTLGDIRYGATELEVKYRTIKRSNEIVDAFNLKANEAATDPSSFPQVYAEAEALLKNTVGIPFDVRMQLEGKLGGIAASAVSGMIDKNPYAAEAQLKSGQWDKYLDPGDRVSLYNGAQAEIKRRESEARAAAAANSVAKQLASINTRFAMKDAIATVRETGKLPDGIDATTVAANVGADDAVTFQNDVAQALDYHAATTGFEALPNQDIVGRIDGLKATLPQPGEPGYAAAVETVKEAEAKADRIITDREQDPAAAVATSPAVREAAANLDRANPESIQAVIDARMKAQRVFVPAGAERPLTKVELYELTAPLRSIPPEDPEFLKAVDVITNTIRTNYGQFAPKVLQQVATRGGLDQDTASLFGDEVYRRNPTARGGKMIDLSSDAARADYAMNLNRVAAGAFEKTTGSALYPTPNYAAIQKLKAEAANPAVVADFDAKFGPGSAAQALKK